MSTKYEVLLDLFMQGSGLLCHPAIYLDLISCKAAAGMGGRVRTWQVSEHTTDTSRPYFIR